MEKNALCSAQAINKRIVQNKLAEKLPNGEYKMTEIGKLFGEYTDKTTRAGHNFSNIEWDEKIFDVIFSKVEQDEIEGKKKLIQEVISKKGKIIV